jgi:hypothetical protein
MWLKFNRIWMVSTNGEVRSIATGKILKCSIRNGYKTVRCTVNKERKSYYVHRMIAETFLPMPTIQNLVIDHMDRDKLNNSVWNLRFTTVSVNNMNKCIHLKDNPTSATKLRYITKYDKRFRLRIDRNDLVHSSIHDTLQSAIQKRAQLVENHALYNHK